MQNLTLSLVQSDLFWEEPQKNLDMFSEKLAALDGPGDLIVLPEMFSTGFSMDARRVAEPFGEGPALDWMRRQASDKGSVLCGSIAVAEGGRFFNRFIWMPPDGRLQYYDKKHLFSHAGENGPYTPGRDKCIMTLKGWKILPMICYDLRFPMWSRNRHDPGKGFDYDILLYVANWPESRSHAWRVLLMGRAIENQCYVVGVNRVGVDGRGVSHSGDSAVIDPMGESLLATLPHQECTSTLTLPRCPLDSFRDQFRAWSDWDPL
jgi:predicted amidohydrolase